LDGKGAGRETGPVNVVSVGGEVGANHKSVYTEGSSLKEMGGS